MTPLDRAVDAALADENRRALTPEAIAEAQAEGDEYRRRLEVQRVIPFLHAPAWEVRSLSGTLALRHPVSGIPATVTGPGWVLVDTTWKNDPVGPFGAKVAAEAWAGFGKPRTFAVATPLYGRLQVHVDGCQHIARLHRLGGGCLSAGHPDVETALRIAQEDDERATVADCAKAGR